MLPCSQAAFFPQLSLTSSPSALFLGLVVVTHVLAYLEAVTGQGSQDERLQTLARSLDPNGEGPQATVDLHTFLSVMRDWIAACQLDGWVLTPAASPWKSFLRSSFILTCCSWHLWGPGLMRREKRRIEEDVRTNCWDGKAEVIWEVEIKGVWKDDKGGA